MIYSIKNIIKSIFIILENTLFSESVIKLTSLFFIHAARDAELYETSRGMFNLLGISLSGADVNVIMSPEFI